MSTLKDNQIFYVLCIVLCMRLLKTLQECITALTSQYQIVFLVFVFLSFCLFAALLFCLFILDLFVFLHFCTFAFLIFFVSSFCLDTTLIDEGYQVSKVNLCVDITKWHWVSHHHHHHHHHKSRSRAARAAKNGKKKPWGKTKSSLRVHLLLLCSSMCPWALLGS